jgi:hypothetical protein
MQFSIGLFEFEVNSASASVQRKKPHLRKRKKYKEQISVERTGMLGSADTQCTKPWLHWLMLARCSGVMTQKYQHQWIFAAKKFSHKRAKRSA